jgi:hypothetical protein
MGIFSVFSVVGTECPQRKLGTSVIQRWKNGYYANGNSK